MKIVSKLKEFFNSFTVKTDKVSVTPKKIRTKRTSKPKTKRRKKN